MISVEGLTVEFGGFTLFDDVSFVVNKKDRIALVGKIGAGNSTMLKNIAGLQSPTSGTVSVPKETTIGYLPQQMKLADTQTVRAEAEQAFAHIHEMEQEIERLNLQLAERTDYESESYQNLIDRVTHLTEHFQMMGGNNYHSELERTLIGLGFNREDFDRPTSVFSGGWRMRIELAKLLLRKPDVLLFDDPTNQLDIESIQWVDNFIATRANAVILVSHDRAFIDNTTSRTIEIELGKIYDYKVKYSEYVVLRKERREQQLRAFENQQKMLADTEAFIERFRYKATKSAQVQSRIKQLGKVDRIEVDEIDTAMLNLKFPPAPRSGDIAYKADEMTVGYGKKVVFSDAQIEVRRGEKVALVGRNGEGKTTLMRVIMGELDPMSGESKVGYNVNIGYYAQNQEDILDKEDTVFGTLDRIAVGDIRLKLRDILGAFLFKGEDIDKKVAVLSGGERARLAMAKLILKPYNLLALDEPTNHMDIRSKDILKQALKSYDGTLIIVSHDRDFLDGLVDKLYEFRDGKVKEHLGGVQDFLERRKLESLSELERHYKPVAEEKPVEVIQKKEEAKQEYQAKKYLSKEEKKIKNRISFLEKGIADIEDKMKEIESVLCNPGPGDDVMELTRAYLENKRELDFKMEEWEKLNEQLDQ